MKKKTLGKLLIAAGASVLGVFVLASCTANFCSEADKAAIMYSYDVGTTCYISSKDHLPEGKTIYHEYNDHLFAYQDYEYDYKGEPAKMISELNKACDTNKILKPSDLFWQKIDMKVLDTAWTLYKDNADAKIDDNTTVDEVKKCLNEWGYVKFAGERDKNNNVILWEYWDSFVGGLRMPVEQGGIGIENCPNSDYLYLYKTTLNQKVNNVRSCITLERGEYGNFGYNHNKVNIEAKDWGYAWSKGFLEGLLIYPFAHMTEVFAHSFGMGGWGQLGAILLVTFIIRTFIALVGFKSTLGQQKMQLLQPELAKLQAKYPNSKTNSAQKQRLAQEQMALYKKHKINPLSSLLILIVQFPIFIAVWGAMQGSAALASDKVLDLYLSESIWNTLTNTQGLPSNVNGWWTALVLFILMAAAQFVSMKLPQWMQKHREKKTPKYLKSTVQPTDQQKQTKWIGYIMLVFIIIMGFTLPAGMGVYWLAGALFSCLQTVVTQFIITGTFKKWGIAIAGFFKKDKKPAFDSKEIKTKKNNKEVIVDAEIIEDKKEEKPKDKKEEKPEDKVIDEGENKSPNNDDKKGD